MQPLAIAFIAAAAVNGFLLLWLLRAYRRLKRQHRLSQETLRTLMNDLAGLCSAGVTVDQRMAGVDQRLNGFEEQLKKLGDGLENVRQLPYPPSEPAEHHPYGSDIQKVKSGATISELMQNSGLTHDEAALLIRLHGKHPGS